MYGIWQYIIPYLDHNKKKKKKKGKEIKEMKLKLFENH